MSSTKNDAAVVLITGGGGFLGQCLASEILKTKTLKYEGPIEVQVERIILADVYFADKLQPEIETNSQIVFKMKGDISDTSYVDSLYEQTLEYKYLSIFHLGAVMSGDGERDFDLCMNVNLKGFMNIIEGARQLSCHPPPTLVLTSAGATIGSGDSTDYITKEDTISDSTRATPHTTYGATKACCELLLSDYSRRGFVRARGLRLPSIVVRAGKPNAATTSCYSGVVREPLNGIDTVLPIAQDVKHAVTGTRHAIGGLLTLHNSSDAIIESTLGFDRTVFLPSVALSLGDLQEALYKVVTEESKSKLGQISYDVDEKISSIVGSFPTKIDGSRAKKLGIPSAPDAETLVRQYAEDFPNAVAPGVEIAPPTTKSALPSTNNNVNRKVAVITGAGSGIGLAVARRLSKGGWTVVLAGRTASKLEEAAKTLEGGQTLCVPTDVALVSDVENLFGMAHKTFGQVDLLFNNAGINCAASSFENVDPADFHRVINTNVTGAFMCARAAMNIMKTHGGGRIINNGSISAHVPRPGSAPYTASKHAMLGLTKCIALDGRANNVACGQIDFGNVVSEMSLATNKKGSGAMQANGTMMEEPSMTLADAAETFWTMANLPLSANVLNMTVMATQMPFVGRG